MSDDSLADGLFEEGDIFVNVVFNGNTIDITRKHIAIEFMIDVRAGDVITFNIIRDGEEKSITLTITEDSLTAY